jgi:hypothetical protein
MRSTIRCVGLDVHKDTVTIAVARGEADPDVVGTVANGWMVLERQLKRLGPLFHVATRTYASDGPALSARLDQRSRFHGT